MRKNNETMDQELKDFINAEDPVFDLYMDEVHGYKPIKKDTEHELIEQMGKGDENARNKLICANLCFVISVAKKYTWSKIPLKELIAAGNLGLVTAAARFDCSRNNGFRTYAIHYVKNEIQQLIEPEMKLQQSDSLDTLQRNGRTTLKDVIPANNDGEPDDNLDLEIWLNAVRVEARKGQFEEAGDFFVDYIKMTMAGYKLSDVAKKYRLSESHAVSLIRQIRGKLKHSPLPKLLLSGKKTVF